MIRSLLDSGAAELRGVHRQVAVEDLGLEPVQHPLPMLIGGNGRRVVGIAGRHADIFQYTGLTHGPGGAVGPGGFSFDSLIQRRRWLEDAAEERFDSIECSALVQRVGLGAGSDELEQEIVEKWSLSSEQLADCPFALFGSVEQVVDKLERLRESLGISHYVVRDPVLFAPVVDALRGR